MESSIGGAARNHNTFLRGFTCSNEIDNLIPSYFLRGAYTIGGNGGITGRVVRNVLQTFLSILRVHGKRRIIHGVHRRNMLVGR